MVAFILFTLVIGFVVALVLLVNPKNVVIAKIIKRHDALDSPTNNIKISIKDAEKYIEKEISDSALRKEVDLAILNGSKYINISQESFTILEARLEHRNGFEIDVAKLSIFKSNAKSFEDKQQLNEAFYAYKQLILFAFQSPYLHVNNYAHDMDRFKNIGNKLNKEEEYDKFMSTLKLDS